MLLRRITVPLGVLFASALMMGTAANAQTGQTVCGDHDEIKNRLAAEYNEVPHGAGLVSQDKVIEIFIAPEERSWTILMTLANGPTCIIATGEAWQAIPEHLIESGEVS